MAIGVLVEALLPGGGGAVSGREPPPKDERGLKEWVRSKLKALASLLGRLGIKAAEVLPGIIGGYISWILKGQLQRFHKLISNDRIWPSEHGFEVIFKKSFFVFEISAFKVRN